MADVSVIIAAYNVEKYIERAITSALDQREVLTEVIVIDDASTDQTVAVVERMQDARIKLIRQTVNNGPSVSRNAGMAIATSPWIAILDGDDAFAPDRLSRCLKQAQNNSADIVIDLIEAHRESDGQIYPLLEMKDFDGRNTLDLAHFIKGNLSFLGGPSLGYVKPLFATAFLRKHNLSYDPLIKIGEDYMLLAEALACNARCVIEPTHGYHYTVRAGSISHRLSAENIERMLVGDEGFITKYSLNPEALKAQASRTNSLKEALAFTNLVAAIKQKNIAQIFAIVAERPTAALHLWRPVVARLQRMFS